MSHAIADKYRPQCTCKDYLLWEGRWDLIDGMPYAKSPAPAPDRQDININLVFLFKTALEQNCKEYKVYIPIDWKVDENTVVQPGALIVCKKIEKKYLDFTPSLTAEILSSSIAFKNRHEKFELYEQQGVKYYLIIDPQFKKIEIYELIKEKYQLSGVLPGQFGFVLETGCRITVNFDGIWP